VVCRSPRSTLIFPGQLPAVMLMKRTLQLRYGVNDKKERERAGKRRPKLRSELDDLKSFPEEDEE